MWEPCDCGSCVSTHYEEEILKLRAEIEDLKSKYVRLQDAFVSISGQREKKRLKIKAFMEDIRVILDGDF